MEIIHRRAALALALCLAAGCTSAASRDTDAASAEAPEGAVDSPSGADVDIGCSSFGLQLTLGCDDCPQTGLTCDCGNMIAVSVPGPCTSWRRCVRAVDCTAVCARATQIRTDGGNPVFELIYALFTCENQAACQDSAQCVGGKCFHPEPSGPGMCSFATAGSPCRTGDDCVSGHCVSVNGTLMCEDGQPGQPCNSAGDCLSGICPHAGPCSENAKVQIVPPSPTITCSLDGQICQEGRAGEFCDTDKDCQSGICVVFSGGVGVCQNGSVYSPCKDAGDCSSSRCVYPPAGMSAAVPIGLCTAGAVREPCAENTDCAAGYCYATAGAVGLCAGGDLFDPCTTAAQCKSQICVRLDPNRDGTCQSGMDPASCATDDDCLNHRCIMRPPGQPAGFGRDHQCNAGNAGSFCWTGADCLSNNCVPVPGKGPGGGCAPP